MGIALIMDRRTSQSSYHSKNILFICFLYASRCWLICDHISDWAEDEEILEELEASNGLSRRFASRCCCCCLFCDKKDHLTNEYDQDEENQDPHFMLVRRELLHARSQSDERLALAYLSLCPVWIILGTTLWLLERLSSCVCVSQSDSAPISLTNIAEKLLCVFFFYSGTRWSNFLGE